MTPGPGMGPYRSRVEQALKYTNPSKLEIGRSAALGISTLCGEYQSWGYSRVRSLVVGVVCM